MRRLLAAGKVGFDEKSGSPSNDPSPPSLPPSCMSETVSVEAGQGKQAMRRLAESLPGVRCSRLEAGLMEGSLNSKVSDRNEVLRR